MIEEIEKKWPRFWWLWCWRRGKVSGWGCGCSGGDMRVKAVSIGPWIETSVIKTQGRIVANVDAFLIAA